MSDLKIVEKIDRQVGDALIVELEDFANNAYLLLAAWERFENASGMSEAGCAQYPFNSTFDEIARSILVWKETFVSEVSAFTD